MTPQKNPEISFFGVCFLNYLKEMNKTTQTHDEEFVTPCLSQEQRELAPNNLSINQYVNKHLSH